MIYSQGQVGRVFVAKIEDGDDLLDELKQLAERENIQAGIIYVVGGLKSASLVVGPQECTLPPIPIWKNLDDCYEILAIGTLFRDCDEPVLHLHGAAGRGGDSLTGCIRRDSKVYLVAEVILLEILNSGIIKKIDRETGLKMICFLTENKKG